MEWFPLPLFPPASLANSVVTTVWVGLFVVCFFNLRLGWVLSGLVTPGYLVPLLILRPWSVLITVIEAMVAYGLVWLIFEKGARLGRWSAVFGRDRFFALVLASVFVRVVFDAGLLPWLADGLLSMGIAFVDYRSDLHSFGLVVIALIANQFWKPGLLRGLVPLVVTVGITYVLVRYVLMTVTNFGISNIGYMYEDVASSVLASPKSYIILLTTCFITSRLNLRYGWDFNGILVPSLLALQWYQPARILSTLVEAGVVLIAARALLQLPILSRFSIEGARKLLFFFNVAFAYKFLLSLVLVAWLPTVKVNDFLGFGYLLSTLLAIKMHDKDIAMGVTRMTVQATVIAVVAGSALGFALSILPSWRPTEVPEGSASARLQHSAEPLAARIAGHGTQIYQARLAATVPAPSAAELSAFEDALQLLDAPQILETQSELQQAARLLGSLGYTLEVVQGRYLYLYERGPIRGWGRYLIDTQRPEGLTVEAVDAGQGQTETLAGYSVWASMQGRALALGGVRRRENPDLSADVTRNPGTLLHSFHRQFGWREALQLRRGAINTLWLRRAIPQSLDLPRLDADIDDLQSRWAQPPGENLQRLSTAGGFAELEIQPHAMQKLAQQVWPQRHQHQAAAELAPGPWLTQRVSRQPGPATNAYRPPSLAELLYIDAELLRPILRQSSAALSDADIAALDGAAAVVGYGLHVVDGALLLAEREPAERHWGSYLLRARPEQTIVVAAPRAGAEPGVLEAALKLFEQLDGSALLIAGADPQANLDGRADVVAGRNTETLFNLVHSVSLREAQGLPLSVQVRAMGVRRDAALPGAQVLIARGRGLSALGYEPPGLAPLVSALRYYGLSSAPVQGSVATAGYELDHHAQALYLDAVPAAELYTLWLSPQARAHLSGTAAEQARPDLRAVGLRNEVLDLRRHLLDGPSAVAPLRADYLDAMSAYLRTGNLVTLRRLILAYPQYRLRHIRHRGAEDFLLIEDLQSRPLAVFRPMASHAEMLFEPGLSAARELEQFFSSTTAALLLSGSVP